MYRSELQSAADVLMIRPASFCANPETATTNRFQRLDAFVSESQSLAAAEFDCLVAALSAAGVGVHAFDDIKDNATPDALFPNNWVSFHGDGSAVLYPMLAQNRRAERRRDVLDALREKGFELGTIVELTNWEQTEHYLEGTGSLVLDRCNRIAYACLSPRTSELALREFARALSYDLVVFTALDRGGAAIYHTNVMLSIGTDFAAICTDSIARQHRSIVVDALRTTGRSIIELSFAQMECFAGNMLELRTNDSRRVVALSATALGSLSADQRDRLHSHVSRLVSAHIPTIEQLGGGSVRCMLAELHLPRLPAKAGS